MRWRKVKNKKQPLHVNKQIVQYVSIFTRFKAFVIDTFMIYIPILYITTYVVLDGKDDFLANQVAIFIDAFLFGFVLSIFFAKTGQSIGYKAYNIQLYDTKNMQKPSFLKAFFRYFCFLFSGAFLFGILLCFFRKDKKNLHDILSKTSIKYV